YLEPLRALAHRIITRDYHSSSALPPDQGAKTRRCASGTQGGVAAPLTDHWSRQPDLGKARWWAHPPIHRHINRLVCGEAIDGAWAGLNRRIRSTMPEGGYARAISIGCGEALKEIHLLNTGLVQHFDLFDLSTVRLEKARERARHFGIEARTSTSTISSALRGFSGRTRNWNWPAGYGNCCPIAILSIRGTAPVSCQGRSQGLPSRT
ncbi:MAG: hypothetical protein KGL48_09805, partial [Sphingomonadales bacterium]|nr:hypothetical protein [Sphingomonadales bacterium]MDE2570089.1 hypothetical protein [Sphingomonadales bacterium]